MIMEFYTFIPPRQVVVAFLVNILLEMQRKLLFFATIAHGLVGMGVVGMGLLPYNIAAITYNVFQSVFVRNTMGVQSMRNHHYDDMLRSNTCIAED